MPPAYINAKVEVFPKGSGVIKVVVLGVVIAKAELYKTALSLKGTSCYDIYYTAGGIYTPKFKYLSILISFWSAIIRIRAS